MSIEQLTKVLKPPVHPSDPASQIGWGKVISEFGELPTDYKEFINLYGTGSVDNFIWIFSPFTLNKNLGLQHQVKLVTNVVKVWKTQPLGGIPFELFPTPGGLFPYGVTDNGDFLFWRMAGAPASWDTVVARSRSEGYAVYDLSMSAFLTDILSKAMICEIFPKDFPSPQPRFTPYRNDVPPQPMS